MFSPNLSNKFINYKFIYFFFFFFLIITIPEGAPWFPWSRMVFWGAVWVLAIKFVHWEF